MGITFLQMLDGPDALPDRPAELVSRISERLYGIHDFRSALFSNEFMAPWRLPHPEFDTVFDVLFGRILIGLHLDPIGLISLSESMGQPLRWATRKEKSGLSETRGISDLAVFKGGMLGTASGASTQMGPGIPARILFDFITPAAGIRMMYHGPDDVEDEVV